MKNGCIIPTFKYKNASAAMDWLCDVLGFKKHMVVDGAPGKIAHAQLTFGNSMIMLGSTDDNEYGKLVKTPNELDGFNTQSPYIIVEKIENHYEHAKANGAKIILPLTEQDYGGKLYTCRDPEGNIWNFGSYNPWVSE
ncbi:MAG: VOC family protein [Chitinophagales bacterium]